MRFWEIAPSLCRVARPHCWGRALQEPDLKLSLHPARALDNAPIKNEDAASFQIRIRPTRYGLAANSHGNGYNPPDVCEAAPTACAVVICVASFIGSANVLEFEYHREVGSVSGEVMWFHKGNATSICPITGQHSLFLSSAIRITIDPPCGFTSPKGSDTDLPCSAERT